MTARGRGLPKLNEINSFFWTSGRDGKLRFQYCDDCGQFQHPPSVVCAKCLGERLSPRAVSGLATVETVTVNHQPWTPGMEVPYAVAIVCIDEQPSLHLTTNVVGIDPEAVAIGQRVRVVFEHLEDVWLPLFEQL